MAVSVSTGIKRLSVTLTREAWPEGPVGSINIKFPDGSFAGGTSFNGGQQLAFNGTVQQTSGLQINGQSNGGVVADLPSGQYAVALEVLQTLTTAVLVESF